MSFTGSVVKVKLMTRSVFFLPSVMHSRSHLSHQRLPKLLSLGGRRDTEGPKGGKNRSVRGNDSKQGRIEIRFGRIVLYWIQAVEMKYAYLSRKESMGVLYLKDIWKLGVGKMGDQSG